MSRTLLGGRLICKTSKHIDCGAFCLRRIFACFFQCESLRLNSFNCRSARSKWVSFRIVVQEVEVIQVLLHVPLANMMIRTVDASVEQTKVTFHSVGGDVLPIFASGGGGKPE